MMKSSNWFLVDSKVWPADKERVLVTNGKYCVLAFFDANFKCFYIQWPKWIEVSHWAYCELPGQ